MRQTRRLLPTPLACAAWVFAAACGPGCAPAIVDFAPPSGGPAAACTPVNTPRSRIVYLVDRSVSLLHADPLADRLAALQRQFDAVRSRPDVDIAVIGYGAQVAVQPFLAGPLFALLATLHASELQIVADLEGGLVAARDLLRDTGGDGTRTQLILITAGARGPTCCNAAEEDPVQSDGWPDTCRVPPWVATSNTGSPACEGQMEMPLCNSPQALTLAREAFPPHAGEEELLLGFAAGADRNRHYRLGALLREMERAATDARGSFRFDIAHLDNPAAAELLGLDPIHLDSCQTAAALERLAAEVVTHSVAHLMPAPDMALPDVLPRPCEEDAALP